MAAVNILMKLLKRQCQSAEEWERSDLLSYCEEVTVARMDEHEDVSSPIMSSPATTYYSSYSADMYQPYFPGSGAIQAITVSSDG